MPRIGKGQKALDRAHKHREDIERLLATTPHWALRGWFLDWAEGQLRRDRFYLFSDNEHAVLAKELSSRMTPCDGWGGYTVDQLVSAAAVYRPDCTEEDDELLTILQRERPPELPLWLMLRLIGICRQVAGVPVPYSDLETTTRAAIREELLS
jgi:hypothetical protein